jgi:putative RNA 2'-phosphotransferase
VTVSLPELSRTVSHALRHEPWLFELELDKDGWAPVDQLLGGLRRVKPEWADIDRSTIEQMLAAATRPRHELRGDRIRAVYGHSVPERIRKERARPPDVLYHGTSPAVLGQVLDEGLKPMRRQYVHLSPDHQTAVQVGLRKARPCAVLRVDAGRAWTEGTPFYAGNQMVWLADFVPAPYLQIVDTGSDNDSGRACGRP